MIFPRKFVAKPASQFGDRPITYAPPQLLVLFAVGLFAPGGLLEYAFFTDHFVIGAVGLLVWVPLLWLLLIEIHDMGRARFWLSALVMVVGHALIVLWLTGRA